MKDIYFLNKLTQEKIKDNVQSCRQKEICKINSILSFIFDLTKQKKLAYTCVFFNTSNIFMKYNLTYREAVGK